MSISIGEIKGLHVFVMVMRYSRALYVEFTEDEKLASLIACHKKAFDWFGGLPEEILYDNPRTKIDGRCLFSINWRGLEA